MASTDQPQQSQDENTGIVPMLALIGAVAVLFFLLMPSAPAAEPRVSFVEPQDGAEVTSPFEVVMSAENIEIEPAGEEGDGGHFHILIDVPFVAPGEVIPADEQHLHFGDGSTTTTLDLPPGEYTLRLQFANWLHEAFEGDQYRDEITITVME